MNLVFAGQLKGRISSIGCLVANVLQYESRNPPSNQEGDREYEGYPSSDGLNGIIDD
jgi:hypothetical protein